MLVSSIAREQGERPGCPRPEIAKATDESRAPRNSARWKCEACIMTLSSALIHKTVCYPCPVCSHELSRSASWFRSVSSFTCESCGNRMRIPYSAKLKLFAGLRPEHRPT